MASAGTGLPEEEADGDRFGAFWVTCGVTGTQAWAPTPTNRRAGHRSAALVIDHLPPAGVSRQPPVLAIVAHRPRVDGRAAAGADHVGD